MAKQVTDGDAFVVTVPDPVPDADGAVECGPVWSTPAS